MVFKCNDCKGTIYFDPLASGLEGNKPVESNCRCVDRDINPDKFGELRKRRRIIHKEHATFIPDYLKKL